MKIIFRPICWINTLWQTLMNPEITAMLGQDKWVWYSGHEWVELGGKYPIGQGDLKCATCGLIDRLRR